MVPGTISNLSKNKRFRHCDEQQVLLISQITIATMTDDVPTFETFDLVTVHGLESEAGKKLNGGHGEKTTTCAGEGCLARHLGVLLVVAATPSSCAFLTLCRR